MAETKFDPEGFYEFDFEKGSVRARTGERVLMVTDTAFAALVSAAAEAGRHDALKTLGKSVGEHLKKDAGGDASPESVLHILAGAMAVYGWGRSGLERWGQAMVLRLDGGLSDAQSSAALLGGLVHGVSGREVACVPFESNAFLVVHPSIAADVTRWSSSDSLGTAVSKLAGASS